MRNISHHRTYSQLQGLVYLLVLMKFIRTTNYISRWNQAEEELASLFHLTLSRPVPTVMTVGGVIDVTSIFGIPHGYIWKGVYADAPLRAVSSITSHESRITDSERQKTFMQLSALQGSVLEHRLFEDDFKVASISTAKLFQLCLSNSELCTQNSVLILDKTNINTVLPTLNLDENIIEDIQNAVNQGLSVHIPRTPGSSLSALSYKNWTGIGYIKENPSTGEAGYMLSGMIAGGMTAVSPSKWTDAVLINKIGRPYAGDFKFLSITYPKNNSVVYGPSVTVIGTVIDPNAKVFVNGIEARVEGTSFTAGGVSLVKGGNVIMAKIYRGGGVTISDSVMVTYRIPLRSYITFPYDGSELSISPIDVEGITSDPSATVHVNGTSALVSSDGRFIARGIILSEGANLITSTASNSEGDTDTQAITINYKATPAASPLQLTITSPANNQTINRPTVLVKGTVSSSADEVWIKVNGVLAEVYNGQFMANSVPLSNGVNRIIVNALDSSGGVGRAEVVVTANTTAPHITLNANITSGIPPLTSYFMVTSEIPNAVTMYQMDFEGDGIIDYTGPTFDNISHAYTTEGIYYPTVIVTDDQGNVYTDTITGTVLNKAKVEMLLKAKWMKMRAALMIGDIDGALTDIVEDSKNKYKEAFKQLGTNEIASIFMNNTDLRIYSLIEQDVEGGAIRSEGIRTYSYPVLFVRDNNGIWKIRDF